MEILDLKAMAGQGRGMCDRCTGAEGLMAVADVCNEFKFSRQTIYNKIYKGEFVRNIHYYKHGKSRSKLLFVRSALLQYLKGDAAPNQNLSISQPYVPRNSNCEIPVKKVKNAINI